MTLPQLMFKTWDGDVNERFTFMDMNRLCYNANILAREAGVTQVTFVEADRTQQFRYDEVQKLENLTEAIAFNVGEVVTIEPNWGPMRGITYRDFERIEKNLYDCYVKLGGVGQRIPDNKFLIVVSATLFPDSWTGTPPSIDLDVPMAHGDAELFLFVPNTATVEERLAEAQARLITSVVSDRVIKVTATGIIPRIPVPIRIALGALDMIENFTLDTTWSGDGPWTKTVTLTNAPENVVVGMPAGMTAEQSRAFVEAGIHASAVNDTTLTIRALYAKPSVSIPIAVYYSESSVV